MDIDDVADRLTLYRDFRDMKREPNIPWPIYSSIPIDNMLVNLYLQQVVFTKHRVMTRIVQPWRSWYD